MKINGRTQNQGGEVCLVMEEGAKFHPKTREEASLKSKLNPRTTSQKNEEQFFNDGRRLTGWSVLLG